MFNFPKPPSLIYILLRVDIDFLNKVNGILRNLFMDFSKRTSLKTSQNKMGKMS